MSFSFDILSKVKEKSKMNRSKIQLNFSYSKIFYKLMTRNCFTKDVY